MHVLEIIWIFLIQLWLAIAIIFACKVRADYQHSLAAPAQSVEEDLVDLEMVAGELARVDECLAQGRGEDAERILHDLIAFLDHGIDEAAATERRWADLKGAHA